MQSIVDKEGEVGREVRAIGDDSYDVGKGFVDKTLCWKGVGRVGEGIEVTAVLYEVHVLCSQSLTRKERLEGKSGLLGMINMMWGRGSWIRLCAGRVWGALEKG